MNCCQYNNITTIAWGCGGDVADLLLLSSREEGGAVADLLIVLRQQQGQWILHDDVVLVLAILDLGLGKSSKELSKF